MKTFRVVRMENGQWQGKQDGQGEILIITENRDLVREAVFQVAREAGPARVLVFDAGGSCIEERTFGPPKPKGYAGDWL
jgi:hypothetical protein